ncbi:MAG: hypothetical protein HY690_04280 [Chloroflexi bacterium]|nr:hypothetical protein [Chloroflexota bacterium]
MDRKPFERRMERRDFLNLAASGLGAFVAACNPPFEETTQVMDSPEGRVVHWEKDDLIVLVSGAQPRYAPGETIKLTVVINNQGARPVQARARIRLVGRGGQAVAEAPVSATSVAPGAAATLERTLPLPRDLAPGDYTLQVELPPWMQTDSPAPTGGGKIGIAVVITQRGE